MKKTFRIALVSLLIIAGSALLLLYFFMRREVPAHARYIPKNAVAVVTLNMRELALDLSSGEHLFPEFAGKSYSSPDLAFFKKAITANKGSGLRESADVLGFLYGDGEQAFFGICAAVKDSAVFGKLLREQMGKQFSLHSISSAVFQFDTSSAIIGWNEEAAVFLYPIGNSDASQTSAQCKKLLSLKEEESVLTNENFRGHELSSFDAGVWMQPEEWLKLSQGGKLMKTYFAGEKYVSLLIDFTDGEVVARKIVTAENNIPKEEFPLLLNCDPAEVKGFYHAVMDLSNDSLAENYFEMPPFNIIPFSDKRNKQLAGTLNGNVTLLIHDTFSYEAENVFYEYDENYERTEKHEKKTENARAFTFSYGLKDPAAAQKLLSTWMAEDSIPFNGKYRIIGSSGEPIFVRISGNVLSFSDWEKSDGQPRTIPDAWEGLDAFLPVGKGFGNDYGKGLAYFFPHLETGGKLLSENIGDLLISRPLIKNNESSCQVRLTLKNKKVNALVQLVEIWQKMMYGDGN